MSLKDRDSRGARVNWISGTPTAEQGEGMKQR